MHPMRGLQLNLWVFAKDDVVLSRTIVLEHPRHRDVGGGSGGAGGTSERWCRHAGAIARRWGSEGACTCTCAEQLCVERVYRKGK